jgi:hypothetical protein
VEFTKKKMKKVVVCKAIVTPAMVILKQIWFLIQIVKESPWRICGVLLSLRRLNSRRLKKK